MLLGKKADIIAGLQTDILRLQGFKTVNSPAVDAGLGPIAQSFPNASFPTGCVHEFLSVKPQDLSASSAFISGILSALMQKTKVCLWISSARKIFPGGLRRFGIEPDHVMFIDVKKEADVAWAMEEALKCDSLAAVVGELSSISFTTSRRLQLAVEQSHATGFILNTNHQSTTTACVSRWKITSLPSIPVDGLPGIGFPRWRVELLRIRNGRPGTWNVQWEKERFVPIHDFALQQYQEAQFAMMEADNFNLQKIAG
jgi:protein ImuA